MRKRIGINIVIMIMAVALCQGCGQKQASTETASSEEEVTEDESKSEDTAKEDDKEEDEARTSDVPLKVLVEYRSHSEYKEPDSYAPLVSGTYAQVQLTDESQNAYPDLGKALETFNKNQEENFLSEFDGYVSDARSLYDDLENKEDFIECYDYKDINIVRADNSYLSVRVNEENYMGGAHGWYGSGGYNYDVASGKELALKDIIPDIATLQSIVKDKLKEKYSDLAEMDLVDESVPEYLTGEADQGCSWFINPCGVDIYFGVYQLGSYAAGSQTVSILYDENPELFCEDFRKQNGNYVEAVNNWEQVSADLNGDGNIDTYCIEPDEDEYGWVNSINVTINGNKTNVEVYGYEIHPYLVHTGDKSYFYIEQVEDNDYRMTVALRVNDDTVEKISEYNGYITDRLPTPDYESDWNSYWSAAFTTPDDIYVGDTIQIFSTHTGFAKAYINDNGELTKVDDYYYAMQYSNDYNITANKDIKADIVDKDSLEVLSENDVLPSGTKIAVYGTLGDDTVDVIDSNGKVYRLAIKSDDWPQTIEGVDIEELFDGIMFAG
ncbi:MAG: DUF3298 and DUF4163 domain-containing protein [Lachnospiraceae bacterium]|nr:DUF3298 and DUF4163 domain-containing protein [Lachnospiraceae bacterium]